MYTRKLYVFHYSRNVSVSAIANSISFTFKRMVQKAVNQYGTVRSYADSSVDVIC